MADIAKYTIFKTKWGYFGLVAEKEGLICTCLPCRNRKITEKHLLACLGEGAKKISRFVGRGLPRQINRWGEPHPTLDAAMPNRSRTKIDYPRFEKDLLKPLQDDIVAYFNGQTVKFDVPLGFNHLQNFTKKVLTACRKIATGRTVSYSQLACMIGQPRAGRAVGNALAKNPVPLIIPCHRVIHSDGSLGNFSAPGGTNTKKKLIALESNEH
jgi:methylated-DNA-[protein]-cysteine S-methyltransferase